MDLDQLAKTTLWPAYQKFTKINKEFPGQAWQNTALIGSGSLMDSLKFVHFLIEIEKSLNASGKLSRGLSSTDPFRTMGSFAEHIQKTLEK